MEVYIVPVNEKGGPDGIPPDASETPMVWGIKVSRQT